MSRLFDAIDDNIVAAVTAIATGSDWTIAAWVMANSAGESNTGRIMQVSTVGEASRQRFLCAAAGRALQGRQEFSTTQATSTSSYTLPVGAWACVACTFRASDNKVRLFSGSLSSAMAETGYTVQTAGVGTQQTAGVTAYIGNNNSGLTNTWDGRLAQVVLAAREWSLNEMEEFRLGRRPVNTGAMRGFWPLDSPTAAQAEDLSGNGAHGTVTGAVVAEDPPIPMGWDLAVMAEQ